jgi:hypothetical protein
VRLPFVIPVALALGLVSPAAVGAQAYHFTILAFPGAKATTPQGINDAGDVTGGYVLPTGTGPGPVGGSFLWSKGAFQDIRNPAGFLTQAHNINSVGQIVGDYFFSNPPGSSTQHGNFVRDPNGHYSDFDVSPISGPPPGFGTLMASNSSGWKVGRFENDTLSHAGVGSFLWRPSNSPEGIFTVIGSAPPPDSNADFVEVQDINDSGEMVGTISKADGHAEGFITSLPARPEDLLPILYPGAQYTHVYGIDNKGDVVGTFASPKHPSPGVFVRSAQGSFSEVVLPPSYSPVNLGNLGPLDINDLGTIVGTFLDAKFITRGFMALPIPETRSHMFFLVGVLALIAYVKRCASKPIH